MDFILEKNSCSFVFSANGRKNLEAWASWVQNNAAELCNEKKGYSDDQKQFTVWAIDFENALSVDDRINVFEAKVKETMELLVKQIPELHKSDKE